MHHTLLYVSLLWWCRWSFLIYWNWNRKSIKHTFDLCLRRTVLLPKHHSRIWMHFGLHIVPTFPERWWSLVEMRPMFLRATSSQNKRRGMKSYQWDLKLQIDVARAQGHKSDDDLRCRSMQHLWRCGSNERAPLCSLYLWRMHQGNVRQRWILGIICLIDSWASTNLQTLANVDFQLDQKHSSTSRHLFNAWSRETATAERRSKLSCKALSRVKPWKGKKTKAKHT